MAISVHEAAQVAAAPTQARLLAEQAALIEALRAEIVALKRQLVRLLAESSEDQLQWQGRAVEVKRLASES